MGISGKLYTGTVIVLLVAIYQYYGIYNQLTALQFKCDESVEKSNNEVRLLTDTLRTRAQDYLSSFKKLKDEYETKDRESYIKIQDLMKNIEREKDAVVESQGNYEVIFEKLQQSDAAKRAVEQDKTNLVSQLAQMQNERSLIEGKKLELQQQLNSQVTQILECRSKEADLTRQLQEAKIAIQNVQAAQQEQIQNKQIPENPQPVVRQQPENPPQVVPQQPDNPPQVVPQQPENLQAVVPQQPVQNIEQNNQPQ